MQKLYERFRSPENRWRGKPFWAWNGTLEKNELLRQIHVMKEMGMGGFFMHSRAGLNTEYLSREWFDLVNACADESEKIGMEAWLYDEDRYPSGVAGGMVSKYPEYRQKSIRLQIIDKSDFRWPTGAVGIWSCTLKNHSYSNLRKINERRELKSIADKDKILLFTIAEMGSSGLYNGYTYIDTMNADATDLFLSLTHQKYLKKCGKRIGTSIKGIFTDEPHRGALLDGFAMYCDDGHYRLPYTQKLFKEFKDRFGYELQDHLPELFLQAGGQKISKVKWQYVELLQQLFIENFARPCQEWCRKHKLALTGHILHEDTLTAQTAMSGSVMRYYEHMDIPGVDVLTEGNKNFWIVKQLQSAGRQFGKELLLSELYGCTGWQLTFKGHRAVGNWQTLFGINQRCPHLSWYTMEGEAKRDYPASILHQSSWYRKYRYVETYFSRFGMLMSEGTPVCDVLVINPVESVWAQVHLGWSKNLAVQDDEIKKIERRYSDMFHWLSGSQTDFDYADEEIMSRHGKISKSGDTAVLKVGKMQYKVVIAAGMTTMRKTTLEILKRFRKAGGHLIFAGNPPSYLDAEKSVAPAGLASSSVTIPFEKYSVIKAIKKYSDKIVAIEKTSQNDKAPEIFSHVRKVDEGYVIALLNPDVNRTVRNAIIKIKGNGQVEEWACTDGARRNVDFRTRDGHLEICADFAPAEERIFVISPMPAQADSGKRPAREIKIEGPFEYRLEEPNICVLDLADWKSGDGKWMPEEEVLKIDQKIRSELKFLHRSHEMLQPWYARKTIRNNIKTDIQLKFMFEAEAIPESVDIAIEEPRNFKVKVNGRKVLLDSKNSSTWIDKAFRRFTLPANLIRKGENSIELTTTYKYNSNIEAIYLLGNFGVRLSGTKRIISRLPARLKTEDITTQKLPFYTGAITYFLPVPERAETGAGMKLHVPGFEAACCSIETPEKQHVIAWEPYEADITDMAGEKVIPLTLYLTRRNTFGPLHECPVNTESCGPMNYTTEGRNFTKKCMLFKSGLTKPPVIRLLRG